MNSPAIRELNTLLDTLERIAQDIDETCALLEARIEQLDNGCRPVADNAPEYDPDGETLSRLGPVA